jgi:hypothetical protein
MLQVALTRRKQADVVTPSWIVNVRFPIAPISPSAL